ncbi:MAG: MarR family winged helix-turn-helix transcriptional regulator [Porcipelethomonas sp.]
MDKENQFCFQYITLSNLIRRYIENTGSKKYIDNITCTNSWIIIYLLENRDRDIFQRDIETAFSIRKSTVSKVIQLMESKNLIKRESVDYDARLKKLVLTDKALDIQKILEEDLKMLNAKFTENLTDEEAKEFLYLIRKIKKGFENEIQ